MCCSEWDVLNVCQTRTHSPHKGIFPPFIGLWSNPTCHPWGERVGVVGGCRREKKMEERWEESTERGWVRGRDGRRSICHHGCNGAESIQERGWVRMCVCVRERKRGTVSECLCIYVCASVCVSNKGEKTTHLNVRYGEAWRAGQEEWGEEGWEEWIWITGMKILLFSARFSDLYVAMI